jgi:hypothetical protein
VFVAALIAVTLIYYWPSLAAQSPEQIPGSAGGTTQPQRRGPSKAIAPAGSHLQVVLHLTQEGTAEVLSATELPGEAVLSDVPAGDFIYEVTSNQQTLAVETMADPFELRGFPDPDGTSSQGHQRARAKTARLIVKIPQATLASTALDRLAVRLYKIKPGVQMEQIHAAALQKMKESEQLEMQLDLPDHQLGPELRQKGRKAELQ